VETIVKRRAGFSASATATRPAREPGYFNRAFIRTVMTVDSLAENNQLADFQQLVVASAGQGDGQQLADRLLRAGKLTTFQSTKIFAGKAEELVLGEYVILDEIGKGGMGQVFKAHHQHMNRVVALKVLSPDALRDEHAQKRFLREVQTAARLLHPNIVAAFDAGETNGRHYLVMEYVEGRDLDAIVRQRGRFAADVAGKFILQAAQGLAFAHSKGVVHRDVKPANLLVDVDQTVKILDMGLARLDEPEASAAEGLTQIGEVMGTAHFMAPEQALDARQADARSDIYSLGCTLYWLLTGEHMYSGTTRTQVMVAHCERPVPNLRIKCTTVSAQLEAIFYRMVAKRPDDRYQKMSNVIAAFAALASDEATAPADASTKQKLVPAAAERTKHLAAKVIGATFVTVVAPILVGVLLKFMETNEAVSSSPTPAATVAAMPSPRPAADQNVSGVTSPETTASPSQPDRPPRAVAPFDARESAAHQHGWANYLGIPIHSKNTLGMDLVLIPPASFLMGSSHAQIEAAREMAAPRRGKSDDAEEPRFDQEEPRHRVTLHHAYLLAATEVTVRQFGEFVAATEYATDAERFHNAEAGQDDHQEGSQNKFDWRHPEHETNDDVPVTQVTWCDAVRFANWLSERENMTPCYVPLGKHNFQLDISANGYRLPTEAEWEFACRAGTTTQFSFGNDVALLGQYAWYAKDSAGLPHPTALKRPNAFGLHDMHGNVAEWCHDWFATNYYSLASRSDPLGPDSGTVHAVRGGSFRDPRGSFCRSAYRLDGGTVRNGRTGFRLLRVISPVEGE
jgi:serine/threonine protein kinase